MSPAEWFENSGAWPLLLLAPAAHLLLAWLDRIRERRLARLAGPRTAALAGGRSPRRRRLGRILFSAALLLAVVAAMQPKWGQGRGAGERGAVDIVVCLDVSRSMLARDVLPSRLERAKREIRALARRAGGDRIALVLFAGEAHPQVPLTRDLGSLADLADLAGPLSVPRGGTDLGAALLAALDTVAGRSGRHEVVVLLTDGEDAEGRGQAVARTCRERGIVVHGVGLGSVRGAKIPVAGEGGETFLRDREGREVVTALDGAGLARIAEITGGQFVRVESGPEALPALYEERIVPMAREMVRARERRERENRYQWPLLAALMLWIFEWSFSERRR